MKTQYNLIIDYLHEHGKITRFNALVKLGVANLPARVKELKAQGYTFNTVKKSKVNRNGRRITYVEYYLAEEQAENQGTTAQNQKGDK